jgi:predicted PurR-regulated permease PerM
MDYKLQTKAFLLLLGLVTIAFFWVLLPFYGAVLWAVILAIVFRPLQRGLLRAFGGRANLAAAISTIICIFIAIVPMTFLVGALVNEGAKLVQLIQEGQFSPPSNLADLYAHLPAWAQRGMDRLGVNDFDLSGLRERLASALAQASQFLAGQALSVGQNTLRFAASIGIMLYVLFFLFRDGLQIGRHIRAALPLDPEISQALLIRFAAVVRATVRGNVIIAVIQGAIGGVTFWFLDLPGALLWGVLMMFLSMLPAVGAALIWGPVAAYFFFTGDPQRGLLLTGIGVFVIGMIDNLLRPPLVGKETRLPDYVVLVSTLGGISVVGINGFVIGPMIAALFLASWTLFRDGAVARDSAAPS